MSASRLGVGMTYVAGLESQLAEVSELLDVIEVEPQTFWLGSPEPQPSLPEATRRLHRVDEEALALLSDLPQAKLVHSVSLPVGSVRTPDLHELGLVADISRRLGAEWISEHLAFNQAHGPEGPFATGFFLPPLQTLEGVQAAAATIRRVAQRLPAPFAFETAVSYLKPRPDELPDGQYIAAVAEQADSLILLDLHNIWTNERNGRQPVSEFLAALPLERVVELHVAGGFEMDGFWLDAHSGLVPKPVLQLLRETLPRLPNVRALIFEMLPAYAAQVGIHALREQLEELHDIWDEGAPASLTSAPARPCIAKLSPGSQPPHSVTPSPQEWEDTLGALSIGRALDTPLARELEADRGVSMYRTLVAEGRAGMLAGALPQTIQCLLEQLGEVRVRALLAQFATAHPPSLFGANEALAFTDYLLAQELALPELTQRVAAERSMILHYLSSAV